jgi:flagellar hook-associated protein 3 FlgL
LRITNKVLKNDFLTNMNRNLNNMRKYQNQLNTGHQINKPSDNPFKSARTMELMDGLSANNKYKENIEEGIGWLSTIDSALGQIGDALQNAREKTIEAGNGTYGPTERKAIADNLAAFRDQIFNIANSAYDGRYIFGGDKTTQPPFEKDASGNVIYKGSDVGLLREMSPGTNINIGVSGSKFSNLPTATTEGGVFEVLSKVIEKLKNNEQPGDILGNDLTPGTLDYEITNILRLRSEAGSNYQRLNDMNAKNETETLNMTTLLAKTYDIDVAEKIMEFKMMEAVYTASLQTSSKIMQPSLLDFIR